MFEMFHKRQTLLGFGGAAVLAAAGPGYAASSLNAGFEFGTLAPWVGSGDARVVTGHDSLDSPATTAHDATFSPRFGHFMAALTNNAAQGAIEADEIASLADIDPGFGGHAVTVGSAISTTFDVQAGQDISFNWLFDPDTDEGNPQTNDDIAFVAGSNGFFSVLANVLGSDFDNDYTWQPFSHTFETAGPITLSIGVLESADNDYFDSSGKVHSALLVDGLDATEATAPNATPTPTALALGLTAGGLLLLRRRRGAA